MKLMKSFICSYLRVLIFYILLMYLVTAPPEGAFSFKWNTLNIVFTLSYLLFYPLLIYKFIFLKRLQLHLDSPITKEFKQAIQENQKASFNHRESIDSIVFRNRLLLRNESRDALMTVTFSFFLQGGILIISGPIILLVGLYALIKKV